MKLESGRMVSVSSAGELRQGRSGFGSSGLRLDRARGGRRQAIDRLANRADVVGRRAAAAADDVDEARFGEFAKQPRRVRGRSSYSPKAFGRPALGWQVTYSPARRDSSATYGRIWLAPNAQLIPTLNGRACRIDT